MKTAAVRKPKVMLKRIRQRMGNKTQSFSCGNPRFPHVVNTVCRSGVALQKVYIIK